MFPSFLNPALVALLILALAILLSPLLAAMLVVPLILALLALVGFRGLAEPEERVPRETHELASPGSRSGIPPTTRPGRLSIPPPPD